MRNNRINDLDMSKDTWKKATEGLITDSLWLFPNRDNSGGHDGSYHGNFVPQIPHQLIKRYTKPGDIVFDPFMGSGTTAIEALRLGRKFFGIDIETNIYQQTLSRLLDLYPECIEPNIADFRLRRGNSLTIDYQEILHNTWPDKDYVDLVILHPPYWDIIKFSQEPNDLSQAGNYRDYIHQLFIVITKSLALLKPKHYLAIVIGDITKKGKIIPLQSLILQAVEGIGIDLVGMVVKDMQENRAKQNKRALWRYRCLFNGTFVFKHEYILIFRKK